VSLFAGAMGRRNNNVAIRIDRVYRREK